MMHLIMLSGVMMGGGWSDTNDIELIEKAFIEGAKWADSHPNEKLVYTKKELLDMGFGFDLNGNIVTPQEIEERSKKYIKHRKDKWVEKTCKWLEPIAEYIGHDSESIKESFKKYINGSD